MFIRAPSGFYPRPGPLAVSRRFNFGQGGVLAWTLFCALVCGGCDDIDGLNDAVSGISQLAGEDCQVSADALASTLAAEGTLAETIPEEEPYPMSIIVSQEALNELFSKAADTMLDPIDVPLGEVAGFDVSATISPDIPLIQIEAVPDCATCIVTEVTFGLVVRVGGFDMGANGKARYQFPVRMTPEGMEFTRVFGDFDKSVFQTLELEVTDDLDVNIPFVDLGTNDVLDLAEPHIKDYVNELVQEEYGAVELFVLEPWEIGNGEVKLLGRGPLLYPEHKTLILGIHTNLVQPLSRSVGLEPVLPDGADIGMQFHPELVQVMVQRMMHEGHVARTYDESGTTMMMSEASDDEGSNFDVTLTTLEQSETADGLLTAGFTLWRTAGGICGSAELQAELGASVGDGGVALAAQDIRIVNGQGLFGRLAETADDWLQSDYMRDVIDVSEFTLNYDELNLPNNKKAQMSADTFRLELGGNGFNIYLNLDAVVERDDANDGAASSDEGEMLSAADTQAGD